jgi:rhodanese-related sulfurtransferase
MKRLSRFGALLALVIGLTGVVILGGMARAQQDVPRITKEDLKPLIGKVDVVIIDVRAEHDWKDEDMMIQGAVREDPLKAAEWMEKYSKEKTLVFYCS